MSLRNGIYGLFVLFSLSCGGLKKKEYLDPATLWDTLYKDVIKENIFVDPKEFWDAAPHQKAEQLVKRYNEEKKNADFDLKQFLSENFDIPNYDKAFTPSKLSFEEYVIQEFDALLTKPRDDGGSLIPTRMYYMSGGGRFQEYNYFRSFFAVKAFQALGKDSLASNIATNCFQFIQDYGYVPYGNRAYYLGFTNMPVLSLMSEAIVKTKPDYLPWHGNLLAQDYQVWMAASKEKTDTNATSMVTLEDNKGLNRYYRETPETPYLSLLKTTEWENSNRFYVNNKVSVSDFIPVDLNALLYLYENMLSKSFEAKERNEYAESYKNIAKVREGLFNKYLYNTEKGFYYDYNFITKTQSDLETLAAVFPLLVGMSSQQQTDAVAKKLEDRFLTNNGVVNDLGQEYGTAEMNYLTILALQKTGKAKLADEIKKRWIDLNRTFYTKNGYILANYNLKNPESSLVTPQRIDGAISVLVALLNE